MAKAKSSLANRSRGKHLNQLRVFRELYYDSPLTKKQLSENTELSTPTVAKALSGLISRGLIAEKGRKDIPTGRKPITYGLDNNSIYGLGVDLEIPDLRVALYDLSRRMVASKGTYVDPDDLQGRPVPYLTEKLSHEFQDLIYHEGLEESSVVGAGIAATGVVQGGSFRPFSRFDDPLDIELKGPLEEELGFPTSFGNDVDLQLLSELDRLGPTEDPGHVALYFSARLSGKRRPAVRIGGSVAIGGDIFLGGQGSAGEFGHMSVGPANGQLRVPETKCGNTNCLESFVNGKLREDGGVSVPDSVVKAVEQNIKDLVYAFSPSLLIVDLDAFPEISDDVLEGLEKFTEGLKETMGLDEMEIREPLDKDRSVTRGAVINYYNAALLDPSEFSSLMKS
ncbi:MAG: ROK family transcriptional regulator [Candidatus Acetothermia bacterium]